MSRIKQSFSWWCFGKENPKIFLPAVKRIGFAGVELLPREMWDVARDAGLAIASHMIGPIEDGLNRPENHARIEDQLASLVDDAVKYGVGGIVVFSGNRRGMGDEQGAVNTAQGLKRLAKIAGAKKITLLLELLNSKVDHKDYQADHTAWGVKVCQLAGSPRVKLLYDIYHMQIMEGDLIRTIQDSHQWIGHYHTAGVPGRRDLDNAQEINYPPVVKAILANPYGGYLGHEFLAKGEPLAALKQAYDLCNV